MNKYSFFVGVFGLFYCFLSWDVFAACPEGSRLMRSKNNEKAVLAYQECAIRENDDDSQLVLARLYNKGERYAAQNTTKALLYYHLAADNGNAIAQTELAKLLLEMDKDDEKRKQLISYLKQIQTAMKNDRNATFKGEILHPYALLSLAAEKQDQKWYYPTKAKISPEASVLLRSYSLPANKKKEVLRAGSAWKQRKMLETAQEVFSEEEYKQFYQTIYPQKGVPDAFLRKQALEKLKEKVHLYLTK